MADPWNHEKTSQSTSIFSMDETFTGSISLSLRAFMFLALAGNSIASPISMPASSSDNSLSRCFPLTRTLMVSVSSSVCRIRQHRKKNLCKIFYRKDKNIITKVNEFIGNSKFSGKTGERGDVADGCRVNFRKASSPF